MTAAGEHERLLELRVRFVSPNGPQWATLTERMIFEEETLESGARASATRCKLSLNVDDQAYGGDGESREEALWSLERALPERSFLHICHQCRFGLYQPFQGSEISCLKESPAVADAVTVDGKYAQCDFSVFGQMPTDEYYWCPDFQRPLSPPGRPGATRRT